MAYRRCARGFTLIELMVVLAIIGVLIAMAAPAFQKMIVMQRLRGINAQLVTDMQFARSEAVARGKHARVNFGSDSNQTCYVIYVADGNGLTPCDCTRGASLACSAAGTLEIRTTTALRNSLVSFNWLTAQDKKFAFDYVTGGLISIPSDTSSLPLQLVQIETAVDDDRRLRNKIGATGRPTVCAPNASVMQVTGC